MTATERRKLAQAARELAMECVAGTAPDFSNSGGWCNCAAAMVVRRAFGFSEWDMAAEATRWQMASDIDYDAILTGATDAERSEPGAVVFPLMWAADELEAQDG